MCIQRLLQRSRTVSSPQELIHAGFREAEGIFETVIDELVVELAIGEVEFGLSLCKTFRDRFRSISAAAFETSLEDLHGRRADKYRKSAVSEIFLEVDAAFDVHVEDYDIAFGPDPFNLGFKGAIELVVIDFLMLYESIFVNQFTESFRSYEVVLHAILLLASWRAGSGGNREFEFRMQGEQVVHYRALSGSRRSRENYYFTFHGAKVQKNAYFWVKKLFMRLVIQRVLNASVSIGGEVVSEIGKGLLVLVGVEDGDTEEDMKWLVGKTAGLRIFNDENGVMNRSILDMGGDVLAVSQFTLTASTRKGNRPSYIRAAGHGLAVPLYEGYCSALEAALSHPVGRGVFGADMQVSLLNDGPVTIIIDSRIKE